MYKNVYNCIIMKRFFFVFLSYYCFAEVPLFYLLLAQGPGIACGIKNFFLTFLAYVTPMVPLGFPQKKCPLIRSSRLAGSKDWEHIYECLLLIHLFSLNSILNQVLALILANKMFTISKQNYFFQIF